MRDRTIQLSHLFYKLASLSYDQARSVLGLKSRFTAEELNKAFKQKALQLHPDHNPTDKSNFQFIELNVAKNLLQNYVSKEPVETLPPLEVTDLDEPGMVLENWESSQYPLEVRRIELSLHRFRLSMNALYELGCDRFLAQEEALSRIFQEAYEHTQPLKSHKKIGIADRVAKVVEKVLSSRFLNILDESIMEFDRTLEEFKSNPDAEGFSQLYWHNNEFASLCKEAFPTVGVLAGKLSDELTVLGFSPKDASGGRNFKTNEEIGAVAPLVIRQVERMLNADFYLALKQAALTLVGAGESWLNLYSENFAAKRTEHFG